MEQISDKSEILTIEDLVKKLKCPLSGKIFKNPVLASDGKLYEEDELLFHFYNGNKLGLSPEYTRVTPISSLVTYLIRKYPDLAKGVYAPEKGKFAGNFLFNIKKIQTEVDKGNYDIILNFDKIYITKLGSNTVFKIISKCSMETLKHFSQNCEDINVPIFNSDEWPLLNYCMKNLKSDRIMIMIQNSPNINVNSICQDDKWTAGHQLFCYKHNTDLINLMVKKGMDLTIKNGNGRTIVDSCFQYSDFQTIKVFLEKIKSFLTSELRMTLINSIYSNEKIKESEKEEIVCILLVLQ